MQLIGLDFFSLELTMFLSESNWNAKKITQVLKMPILMREEEILNIYLLTAELVTFIFCELGTVHSSMTYTLMTAEEAG